MAKKKKSIVAGAEMMAEIKKMEAARRDKAMKHVDKKEEKIAFNAWWMLCSHKVPRVHMKEIILADFKGRGLSTCEKSEDYDKALAAYGVKLC